MDAKSDLLLVISPSELKQVKNCNSSKEVWDALQRTYQSSGPARMAMLLMKLVVQKIQEGDNIRDHLNSFFDTVDKLLEMDIQINDNLLAIMMPYSLPATFENFRITIETRDKLPSPQELRIKILEETQARCRNDLQGTETTLGKRVGFLARSK